MRFRSIVSARLFLLGLLSLFNTPLQANSGPVVVAQEMARLPDHRPQDCEELGFVDPAVGEPTDRSDLSACFTVAYDANRHMLRVIAWVEDDIRVTGISETALPNGLGQNPDGALVYLDLRHRSTFAEKIELSLVSREIAAADDALLSDGIVEIERSVRSSHSTVYSWLIDMQAIASERGLPDEWLRSGAMLVGFDLVVFDRDSESDGAILKWAPGANDGMENRDLGDLLIWPETPQMTVMSGHTQWAGHLSETRPPRFAHFVSEAFPHITFRALTDATGEFELALPQGDYLAVASDSRSVFSEAPQKAISVRADDDLPEIALTGRLPDAPLAGTIAAMMQEHGVRTVGIGWMEGGQTRLLTTLGQEADDSPADDETVFRTASITKLVTTMTVLDLVAKGEWELDSPLSGYWTETDLAHDERYRSITTRMVLRHLTGLPNWRGARALAFEAEPGAQQGYSGEAFEILRRALEQAKGESLEKLARRHIFEPAGMTRTSLRYSPFVDDRFAGEFWATGAPVRHYRGDAVNGAANMLSTPGDLLRFAEWFIAWCEQHPELAQQLAKPNGAELLPDDRTDWSPNGLGWFVQDRDGPVLLEHSGGQAGINTHLLVVPETRSALVVLTNSSAGWPIVRAVFQQTLGSEGGWSRTRERLYGDIRF